MVMAVQCSSSSIQDMMAMVDRNKGGRALKTTYLLKQLPIRKSATQVGIPSSITQVKKMPQMSSIHPPTLMSILFFLQSKTTTTLISNKNRSSLMIHRTATSIMNLQTKCSLLRTRAAVVLPTDKSTSPKMLKRMLRNLQDNYSMF